MTATLASIAPSPPAAPARAMERAPGGAPRPGRPERAFALPDDDRAAAPERHDRMGKAEKAERKAESGKKPKDSRDVRDPRAEDQAAAQPQQPDDKAAPPADPLAAAGIPGAATTNGADGAADAGATAGTTANEAGAADATGGIPGKARAKLAALVSGSPGPGTGMDALAGAPGATDATSGADATSNALPQPEAKDAAAAPAPGISATSAAATAVSAQGVGHGGPHGSQDTAASSGTNAPGANAGSDSGSNSTGDSGKRSGDSGAHAGTGAEHALPQAARAEGGGAATQLPPFRLDQLQPQGSQPLSIPSAGGAAAAQPGAQAAGATATLASASAGPGALPADIAVEVAHGRVLDVTISAHTHDSLQRLEHARPELLHALSNLGTEVEAIRVELRPDHGARNDGAPGQGQDGRQGDTAMQQQQQQMAGNGGRGGESADGAGRLRVTVQPGDARGANGGPNNGQPVRPAGGQHAAHDRRIDLYA